MVEQRPLLLNDVILRQNPHNVHEWMKRIRLQKKAPKKILSTYMEAIETIKPSLAKGKLCTVWLSLANYYEFFLENLKKENDKDVAVESNVSQAACVENARGVYRKASAVNFRTVEECASVWCAWVEMELRQDGDPNHLVNALNVAQQVCGDICATVYGTACATVYGTVCGNVYGTCRLLQNQVLPSNGEKRWPKKRAEMCVAVLKPT